MRLHLLGVTALMLVLVASCFASDEFILQPEDVLNVVVYGHDDLSRDVVVLRDGYITLPIAGRVLATGKTAAEVAQAVEQGLMAELRAPKVTVSVKQPAMRRVYVSGLVAKAGSYDLKSGWRISHLIAEAGGLEGKPDLVKGTLIRDSKVIQVEVAAISAATDLSADLLLQPGDVLQIQADTNLVHIAGQVRTPGDYQLKSKLGILEAVSMAGGVTDTAALTRAHIVRKGQLIPVDLRSLLIEGKSEANIEVMPGDTVVIPVNEARIAVLGGVQSPGYFALPDGKEVTVADAIGMAHGPNKNAKLNEVALIRMAESGQTMSEVNFSRFLKQGDVTQNPKIRAGDVIYVTDGTKVEKPQILSALTSLVSPLLFGLFR